MLWKFSFIILLLFQCVIILYSDAEMVLHVRMSLYLDEEMV